jgi:hypothetical protein
MARGEIRRREPTRRVLGGRHVMKQDVGLAEEAIEHRTALAASKIGDDPALVRVQVDEEPALLRVDLVPGKRSPPARDIATRGLDLHDVGAEIGKELRGVRGGDTLAAFDDPNALETSALLRRGTEVRAHGLRGNSARECLMLLAHSGRQMVTELLEVLALPLHRLDPIGSIDAEELPHNIVGHCCH